MPFSDESLASFLNRWARANVLLSRLNLLNDIEVQKAVRISADQLQKLALSLKIPLLTLQSISPTDNPPKAVLRRSFTRPMTEAVCPHCLILSGYSRQLWSHALATACASHGNRLIDRCPECQGLIKQDRPAVDRCGCGASLRNLTTLRATNYEVEFSKLLTGDLPTENVFPLDLQHAIPAEIDLFFWGLANHFAADAGGKSQSKAGKAPLPKTTEEAVRRMVPLFELFSDWPKRFDARLGLMIAAATPTSTGAAARFGRWYFFLFRKYPQEIYNPMRIAAANRIIQDHDGLVNARTHNLTDIGTVQKEWYSVKEAAAELWVSADRINDGIDRYLINARVHDESAGYRQRFLARDELDRLRKIQYEYIDDGTAMALLRVPKSIYGYMCDAGWIIRAESNNVPPVVSGYIEHKPLLALIDRLCSFAMQIQRPMKGGVIPLRELNLRRTTDLQRLLGLFRAIAAGDIQPVGYDDSVSIGDLLYSQAEVDRHVASWFVVKGLTLQQIGDLIGAHGDAVKAWVNEGILAATQEPIVQGSPWIVNLRDLIEFLQTYTPLARQANVLGSSTRGLTKCLEDNGISIVQPAAGRGALVKISDLMVEVQRPKAVHAVTASSEA